MTEDQLSDCESPNLYLLISAFRNIIVCCAMHLLSAHFAFTDCFYFSNKLLRAVSVCLQHAK